MMELLHSDPFFELTILLFLAALVGFVGQLLRQPMIVSFIAVGILAGPSALDLVQSRENIELLAELGIAVLLFLVGLKLDLKLVRTIGSVSLATGLGQVTFTALVGLGIGLGLGLDLVSATYVAVALTFSSTIIIVKLLSDKKEVDSLHGRIAIGFLIVQDIVVVLSMMILSAVGIGGQGNETDTDAWLQIVRAIFYGAVMLVTVGVFIRYLATPITRRVARSPELLIIFSIAWAAVLATLAEHFGFGKELGGLLAGVSLASTPFREAIVARLSSLRDFLLLFFFISLGAQLDLGQLGAQVGPATVLSLFVLIGNPLIVVIIMGIMGYRKRTGFLAGLTVAQISEFSLIFMAMGLTLGHVDQEDLALVTLVGLITIAMSVYMITYSHTLYRWVEKPLSLFERKVPFREQAIDGTQVNKGKFDVILFGLGRYGNLIARKLEASGYNILAVDFNPDVVRQWRKHGGNALFGDASDQDFMESLPLSSVRWVVSAIPQQEPGLAHEDPRIILVESLRAHGYEERIALSTHIHADVEKLRLKGVDLIFLPFQDAADRAVEELLADLHQSRPKQSSPD